MTWPIPELPTSGPFPRTDNTPAAIYHAQDHNDLINSVNDIADRIGNVAPRTSTYFTTEDRMITRTRSYTFVVAPADAADLYKESADVILPGASGAQNDGDILSAMVDQCSKVGGGSIFVAPGTVHLYQSIVFNPQGAGKYNNVDLVGSGMGTVLRRRADVPVIDVRGTSASASNTCRNINIENFYFNCDSSDGSASWKTPGVKIRYATSVNLRQCNFNNFTTAALRTQAWADSFVQRARFDACGTVPSDPTQYAVIELLCATTSTGEQTSNIYFEDIIIDTFNTGALKILGNSNQKVDSIFFNRLKVKNETNVCGTFADINYGDLVVFDYSSWYVKDFRSGYSTPINVIKVTNSTAVMFEDPRFDIGAASTPTVNRFLYFDGPNNRCGFRNASVAIRQETSSLYVVDYNDATSSNYGMVLGPIGWTTKADTVTATRTVKTEKPPTSLAGEAASTIIGYVMGTRPTEQGTSITLNGYSNYRIKMNASGSITIPAARNHENSVRTFWVAFIQDGTGNRTVTWPSNVVCTSGTKTLSTAGSAIDIFQFTYFPTVTGSLEDNWILHRVGTAVA